MKALLIVAVAMLGGLVHADGARPDNGAGAGLAGKPTPRRRLAIDTPVSAYTHERAGLSRVIYLERCRGGCRVTGGSTNDARNFESTIPSPGSYTITEFENGMGGMGAAADAEWSALVTCMKEVYSPFDVEVTDVKPASGSYHLAIIAGNPQDVGLERNVLGVAPLASNCAAFDNVISFSFSGAHPQKAITEHMLNVCWTAAQESAHAFGLDHQFAFIDGKSACTDPMTYRADCGGQKFYRNQAARCGEEEDRDCRCSLVQNSHRTLLERFGPGTPLTGSPTVEFNTPPEPGAPLASNIIVTAGSRRGVAKVELFLNGFPVTTVGGGTFGASGQPTQAYLLVVPELPDSLYDMFVRASDDLGNVTDTPTVQVVRGGPCTTASACLPEQKCEEGRCFWDPPVGELGDGCGFDQECKSLLCHGNSEGEICTQVCDARDVLACPQGMSCNNGVCFPTDSGGCCSAAPDDWMPAGLLAFLVAVMTVGRKARRNSQSSR